MLEPKPSESNFLKTVLEPLLEDFRHWLSRSRHLLETEDITFLTDDEQANLLARVKQAQQEVNATQSLMKATGAQVGVEMSTLMPWHQLLMECWQVSRLWRSQSAARGHSLDRS